MARSPRVDVGGEIYHVINRANGRFKIFETEQFYSDFEALLYEMRERFSVRILAYIVMPNHWHLLLWPEHDGDMGRAMQWLGTKHTRRFHTMTGTVGGGHLYQGRYKSFLVQGDLHFLSVLKYVERNAARARMVSKAEQWRWGSAHRRIQDMGKTESLLTRPPTLLPKDYIEWINIPENSELLKGVRLSVVKGVPYGSETWRSRMTSRHNLTHTLRNPGRPKNGD